MLFDAIFLALFFLAWVVLGGLPWLAWSVRRRADGAIWALPFALLGGGAGGVLVPVLGLDTGTGIGVSMVTAPAGGALLTAAAYWVWDAYALGDRFGRLRVAPPPETQPPDVRAIMLIAGDFRPPKPASTVDANPRREPNAGREANASLDSNGTPTAPVDTAPVDTAPVNTAPVDTAPMDSDEGTSAPP